MGPGPGIALCWPKDYLGGGSLIAQVNFAQMRFFLWNIII